jgi:RNA polymerase sigma-70 factor (ECF subfamily)
MQPAVAVYLRGPGDAEYRAFALDVLRLEGGSVVEILAFDLDEALLAALGLPPTL